MQSRLQPTIRHCATFFRAMTTFNFLHYSLVFFPIGFIVILVSGRFLFATDGFEMYEWLVKRLLTGVCIYGQVIKQSRENRVVRVDRRRLLEHRNNWRGTVFLRRFEHLEPQLCGAPQFNHPPMLCLPWPSHTWSRPSYGILGRPGGPPHGVLQLRASALGSEIR